VTAEKVLIAFSFIVFAVAIWQAHRLGRDGLSFVHWRADRPLFRRLLRGRALSLVIVSGVTLAFADIVMLIAGILLPSSEVAVVGVAVRLAALAGFILQATQQFVLPDLTDSMTRQDQAGVQAILWKTNIMTLALGVAALVGCLVLGQFALSIFGADYVSGFWLLLAFLGGQCLRAAGGMNQQILAMNGFQLRTAGSCAAAIAVLVVASLVWTKAYGMNGLGFAVIAAELVWMVALAWQAGKLCGLRGDIAALLMKRGVQKPMDITRQDR
jgi:O-antigen/teichoic acid export membrane protein